MYFGGYFLLLALLIFILFLIWISVSNRTAPTSSLTQLAEKFFTEGRFDEALASYNKLIIQNPNDYTAYGNRASVQGNLGHFDALIVDAEMMIRLEPDNYRGYHLLAFAYAELGKFGEALSTYNEAIALQPELSDLYLGRMSLYAKIGKFSEALDDANNAIRYGENNFQIYYYRARIYRELKQYQESIYSYDKAYAYIENEEQHYLLLKERSEIFQQIKDFSEALADIEELIEIKPMAESYEARGQVRWLLADYTGALTDYQEAINRATEPNLIHFLGKAASLCKLGRPEEALAIWRENNPKSITNLQDEYRFAQPFYETLLELEKLSQE